MTDKNPVNPLDNGADHLDGATTVPSKEGWAKPEIVDYQPVTVARGISYRIGDGVNNLS